MDANAEATRRLRIALDQLVEIQNLLREHEQTQQDRLLPLVHQKMRDMVPDLDSFQKTPACSSPENRPLLVQLSQGVKAAFEEVEKRVNAAKQRKQVAGSSSSSSSSSSGRRTSSSSSSKRSTTGRSGLSFFDRSSTRDTLAPGQPGVVSEELDFNNPATLQQVDSRPMMLRGWLKKLGEKGLQRWSRRFFVVEDEGRRLAYYKSDTLGQAQGFIRMEAVWKIISRETDTRFAIELYVEGARTYLLEAESHALLNYWVQGIKQWRFYQIHNKNKSASRPVSVPPSSTTTTPKRDAASSLGTGTTPKHDAASSLGRTPTTPMHDAASSLGRTPTDATPNTPRSLASSTDGLSSQSDYHRHDPVESLLRAMQSPAAAPPPSSVYSPDRFDAASSPPSALNASFDSPTPYFASSSPYTFSDAKPSEPDTRPSLRTVSAPHTPALLSSQPSSAYNPSTYEKTLSSASDFTLSTAYDKSSSTFDKSSSTFDKPSSTFDKPSSTFDKPSSTYDQPSAFDKPSSAYDKSASTGYDKASLGHDSASDKKASSGYEYSSAADSSQLRELNSKLLTAQEQLEAERSKSAALEARLAAAERRIAESQQSSQRSAKTSMTAEKKPPLSFGGFQERLRKQHYTTQQQDVIMDRLAEFEEEFRAQEDEQAMLVERQQAWAEQLRVKDERIKDLQYEVEQARAELRAKDRHIQIIDAQLKEARGTGRFAFLGGGGKSSSSSESVNVQALVADLRERCNAHQEQVGLLARELQRSKEIADGQLKAKGQHVDELVGQLAETRRAFQNLRRKYLLATGIDEDVLNELDATRKELFFALALGIKLNLASSGAHSNIDVAQLYDEAKSLHYSTWNEWILRRIDEQNIGQHLHSTSDRYSHRFR